MTISKQTYSINLHYIRAAIEKNTGIRLSLEKVRQYLVEEKLITPRQAKKYAQIFTGYDDFYGSDTPSRTKENPSEVYRLAEELESKR
jgi:regulator of replication initiation timing